MQDRDRSRERKGRREGRNEWRCRLRHNNNSNKTITTIWAAAQGWEQQTAVPGVHLGHLSKTFSTWGFLPFEGHRTPGSVWPLQALSALRTEEIKSLLSGQEVPLRLNNKQPLLIWSTRGHSLDRVTIMRLEIMRSDISHWRLAFRAMTNKSLFFSGPWDPSLIWCGAA